MSGAPFKIDIPEEVLADLRERLARTRWPQAPEGPDWLYGASAPYMRQVAAHWRDRFDWRAWERRLNGIEQVRETLDGVAIHAFIERGSGKAPTPLVLTHGWPGSAIELLEMIEPLAHPERFGGAVEDAFTVVVPSLPGCGFSGRAPGPISPREVGELWSKLMRATFGFDRYIAHGGDWGAAVSSWIAVDHPDELIGLHLNTAILLAAWSLAVEPPSAEEDAHSVAMSQRLAGETGYQVIQGTKPLSLAYGLTDSPVGLAAWILEKFQSWTVADRIASPPFDLDHLIANVMFYWLGDAQAASWMYRYMLDGSGLLLPAGVRVQTPTGFCLFPNDVAVPPPDSRLRRSYNVVHVTRAEAGGHFPGLECPMALANDIRAFGALLRTGAARSGDA